MSSINARNKPPLIPLNGPVRHLVDTVLIVVGSLITALAFNLFMLPNRIASGGVSGLSVLAQAWFGAEPAFTQWALNIPLFFLGVFMLGRQYGLRSLLGSFVLPLFIYLTKDGPVPTHNPLLASIYGGIGVGLGLGLVFRGRGSTGGLSILAQVIQKLTGFSFSLSVVLLDGTVITLAAFVLGMEQALYALIGLFVTGKVIDALEVGFSYTKVAYIISDHTEAITEAILHDLDRGLTKLDAKGGYTGDSRTVLMVAVGQNETTRLKAIVRSVDPGAFVIISDAHEVLGEGFKREA
ncbi:YitT family protein [Paenibacillus sp. HN-1]|uniref:YitT family protein n=1 Tax=Paenibacillus TaxID=44249 RepID=UPI001CA9FD04|nr:MULTISPECIES: YitT family protein [Paenibacillus]MBY9077592.1 YitT family protein [Paenibacillus sp. CGMCC 1.18879]MBY9087863.1 YitT family protein [Paenibacillus sinensis]